MREESIDATSDGDESVSLNPSITGFVPLIDESMDMDPLLDQISNHPVPKSEKSSSYGTDESSDDDTSEEEEFGDIDNDGEDGEGKRSSIMWSEDDRKNVANLGTIEQERNERLESVIARRRWQRLMAEKSLIDLDSSDFPTNNNNVAPTNTSTNNNNAAPKSAARVNNPFDLPQIPGSAPSVVKPRSNPFDLPFHINEERSEPLVNVPHRAFPPKEMAFRRHESFSVGPSFSGESLLDELSNKEASFRRHESFRVGPSSYRSRLKPYFVPERMDYETESETESVSSDSDEESSHQPELISDLDHVFKLVEHGSESSSSDDDDEEDSFELGQSERNKIGNGDVKSKAGVVVENKAEAVLKVPETSSPSLRVKIPENDKAEVALESVMNSPTESHREPIYDSSPRGIHKDLSSSSISSEVDVIFPETGEAPVLVKRTVSFANRESNVGTDNNKVDDEKKPTVVADSVDKVAVLQPNPDQIQSSTVDEKSKKTLREQLPSSDKSMVDKSSGVHEKLQEKPSITKMEVVPEPTINTKETGNLKDDGKIISSIDSNVDKKINPASTSTDISSVRVSDHGKDETKEKKTISHDHKQENIKEIGKSKNDRKTKSSLELSTEKGINSKGNSADVSDKSASDHGKDKEETKKPILHDKKEHINDGEKKPTSSENKTVVTDSVDKVVVLQPNPDQIKSSTVDEKSKQTLGELLPSSDKSTVGKSKGVHGNLQEKPSTTKLEAVLEPTVNTKETGKLKDDGKSISSLDSNVDRKINPASTSTDISSVRVSDLAKDEMEEKKKKSISHDHKQENINDIGKSKNGETKSSLELSTKKGSNSKINSADVSDKRVFDHGKDKEEIKKPILHDEKEHVREVGKSKNNGEINSSPKESNVGTNSNEIDGEKKPSSSENKTVVTDSVDKVDVLQPNPDQTKSSNVDKKSKQTLGEQLPSSDKLTVEKSSGVHEKVQETRKLKETGKLKDDGEIISSSNVDSKINPTSTSTDISSVSVSELNKDTMEEKKKSISHDLKQENIKEIGKSKNDGETKSSLELSTEKGSNSKENSADVSDKSLSDHSKDKETKKPILHDEKEHIKEVGKSKNNGKINSGPDLNSTNVSSVSVCDHGKEKEKEKENKMSITHVQEQENDGKVQTNLTNVSNVSVSDQGKESDEKKKPITHDQGQQNITAIAKSEKDGEIKNSSDMNVQKESKDVSSLSVAEHGKEKEEKKAISHDQGQENTIEIGKSENDGKVKSNLTNVSSVSVSDQGKEMDEKKKSITHDQGQQNITAITKSEKDGEIKSSSNMNVQKESNPINKSKDVSSLNVSEHGKEKEEKKAISHDQGQENTKEIGKSETGGEIKSTPELKNKKESDPTANSTNVSSVSIAGQGKDSGVKEKPITHDQGQENIKETAKSEKDEGTKSSSDMNIQKESKQTDK